MIQVGHFVPSVNGAFTFSGGGGVNVVLHILFSHKSFWKYKLKAHFPAH